jgi:HEAT repeat protein
VRTSLPPALVLVLAGFAFAAPPANPIVERLADTDAAVRAAAARELIDRDNLPADVVAALRRAVTDPDRLVHGRAAVALWTADPKGLKDLLPGLLAARNDPDEAVRAKADAAWAEVGPGVRAALPFVRRALATGNDPQAQPKAVEALARPGLAAVPALLDAVAEERPGPFGAAPRVSRVVPLVPLDRFPDTAVQALVNIGPDAVPTLAGALGDGSPAVREVAAVALGRLGLAARPALPALIALFRDRDPVVRMRAAESVGQLGPAVPGTEPALIGACAHRDPVVRRAAVTALARFQPPSPAVADALTGVLDDPEPFIRMRAAEALCQGDPPAAALESLIEELRGRDSGFRVEAAQLLERVGAKAGPIRDRIAALTADRDRMTRVFAARVQIKLGGADADRGAKVLRELLDEETPAVRARAAEALWEHGARAETLPVLVAAAGSNDPTANQIGRNTLNRIDPRGPGAKDLVPALAAALADENPVARNQVLSMLSRMGTTARPAAPAVARLLGADQATAQTALSTLSSIGGPTKESIPDLVTALRSPTPFVRTQVIRMIQQLGSDAQAAIPALKELVKSGPADARVEALRVLRAVSRDDFKDAAPLLAEVIAGKDLAARALALQLAGELGADAKVAVPAVKELLGAKDLPPGVRVQALRALQRISPGDLKDAAAAITDILRSNDRAARNQAILFARELGPDAIKTILPVVAEGLKTGDRAVRMEALILLQQMNAGQVPEARDLLLELLKDPDPTVRFPAAQMLELGGVDRTLLIPALTELLKHDQAAVRAQAAETLTRYGPAGIAAALPVVREGLKDADPNNRLRAARTISQAGEAATADDRKAAVEAVTTIVRDGTPTFRTQAIYFLQQADPGSLKAAAPGLRAALADAQPTTRVAAARLLSRLDGDDRAAGIEVLAALVADRASPARFEAVAALRAAGPDGLKVLVPVLTQGLKDAATRQQSLVVIGQLDEETVKPLLPAVGPLLDDPQPLVRLSAARILARAGDETERKAAGELLVALVKAPAPEAGLPAYTRTQAADVLRGMGGEWARAALPVYREMLSAPVSSTRLVAARVLVAEGGPDAVAAAAALSELTKGPGNSQERIQAAELLAHADHARVGEAVEVLKALAADKQVASFAVLALLRVSPDRAAEVVPVLRQALKTPGAPGRSEAARALGLLGPVAREAIPDLAWMAGDSAAALALGSIGGDAIPVLIRALGSHQPAEVTAAAGGLGSAGPEAAAAVPELIRLAHGENPIFLSSARLALAQIGPPAVAGLVAELTAPDPARRKTAQDVLLTYRGPVGPAAAALEEACAAGDPDARAAAGRAAYQAGSRSPAVIRALAGGFGSADAAVRRGVASAVADSGAIPAELVAEAKAALGDRDRQVRVSAAAALATREDTVAAAAPILVEALQDTTLRRAAIAGLATAVKHPSLKPALPTLRLITLDPNAMALYGVTDHAAIALGRLGGAEAVGTLVAAMRDQRYTVFPPLVLASALREAGPEGVAALVKLQGDANPNLRIAAIDSLGAEAVGDRSLLQTLTDRLGDSSAVVRAEAVRALRHAGGLSPAAVEPLLRDAHAVVRAEAALALLASSDPGRRAAAVKELRAALIDPTLRNPTRPARPSPLPSPNRLRAIASTGMGMALVGLIRDVGEVGPAAAGLADVLRKFRADPDRQVREAAAEALSKIEPNPENRK